jgi:hypothetical protein
MGGGGTLPVSARPCVQVLRWILRRFFIDLKRSVKILISHLPAMLISHGRGVAKKSSCNITRIFPSQVTCMVGYPFRDVQVEKSVARGRGGI